MDDIMTSIDKIDSMLRAGRGFGDRSELHGRYHAECHNANGEKLWEDDFDNVVATVGKNLALDTFLAGSAYTATGPFMGLISSVSFSAVAAGDTMASHAGWTEAGSTNAPTFSARITTNGGWSASSAGAKALSAALSFTMTSAGTVQGAFLVYGTGAVATLMSTAGTLLSAGVFSGGAKVVANTDVLSVSYSLSL